MIIPVKNKSAVYDKNIFSFSQSEHITGTGSHFNREEINKIGWGTSNELTCLESSRFRDVVWWHSPQGLLDQVSKK